MIKSTFDTYIHVAIVMDGNGRWARRRGRPRGKGHQAGVKAVSRIIEAAQGLGIKTLTLYAFSTDNWHRPASEVDHLMRLFENHLRSETDRCVETGIRVSVIGRRSRLPRGLREQIDTTEARTRRGNRVHVRFAVDYSSRDTILGAVSLMNGKYPTREAFSQAIAKAMHAPSGTGDVDLLIRTGGEKRLSDFLLWESAYAEFVFTPCLWPDFTTEDLGSAVREFHARDRRYGGLSDDDDRALEPSISSVRVRGNRSRIRSGGAE